MKQRCTESTILEGLKQIRIWLWIPNSQQNQKIGMDIKYTFLCSVLGRECQVLHFKITSSNISPQVSTCISYMLLASTILESLCIHIQATRFSHSTWEDLLYRTICCCCFKKWHIYLQNCEMGASSWGTFPPLALSFCTWVGGTGLCDCPVARYMAWTHKMRSCSSSLANITVSPSLTALKKARPPSKPARIEKVTWTELRKFRRGAVLRKQSLLLFLGQERGKAIYLTSGQGVCELLGHWMGPR